MSKTLLKLAILGSIAVATTPAIGQGKTKVTEPSDMGDFRENLPIFIRDDRESKTHNRPS